MFVCAKTFHLPAIIHALKGIFRPGIKIVSTHNGLGTEDVIAEVFGSDAVFRMTLNYGVTLKAPCQVATALQWRAIIWVDNRPPIEGVGRNDLIDFNFLYK